jgi:hypothetical protein
MYGDRDATDGHARRTASLPPQPSVIVRDSHLGRRLRPAGQAYPSLYRARLWRRGGHQWLKSNNPASEAARRESEGIGTPEQLTEPPMRYFGSAFT